MRPVLSYLNTEVTSSQVEAVLLSLEPEKLAISQWTRVEFVIAFHLNNFTMPVGATLVVAPVRLKRSKLFF
ncbi:MAG: hypothetical protein DRR16_01600 [Candidatus Parabeggiatoa sp. nov. 3]|nr:MAG: hypothetical protein DRR00_03885 [Gammaproteobacteria bacterium]RKZ68627.1 MAG: hypothetical protein DRQ99_03265 [Gammaproteobacteria bacterium]RKZ89812.1 MAG: hypothetical protein DRR16_01600 [Gammaproteobacteria bacterium]